MLLHAIIQATLSRFAVPCRHAGDECAYVLALLEKRKETAKVYHYRIFKADDGFDDGNEKLYFQGRKKELFDRIEDAVAWHAT